MSQHGQEIDNSHAPELAMYKAPEGTTPCESALNAFVAETNANPRPFRWTKDPDTIIAAVRRGHQALNSIH